MVGDSQNRERRPIIGMSQVLIMEVDPGQTNVYHYPKPPTNGASGRECLSSPAIGNMGTMTPPMADAMDGSKELSPFGHMHHAMPHAEAWGIGNYHRDPWHKACLVP